MTVFPAAAIAWAKAVLPQPGGPSTITGFCIRAARETTCRVTGSITYFAASNSWPRSSIDENTTFLWPDCTGKGLSIHTLVQPPPAVSVSSETQGAPHSFASKFRWAVTVLVGQWPPGP